MTNDAGGIIDNKFKTPEIEFGNIYLFMNITNNGIVNDCGIINPPHKVYPTKPVLCDMDQDYLLDSWETNGIDFNHDKTIDLTLAGANEMHKDLYLEIDYMTSHQPSNAVITKVVDAFANAPQALVNNPDGLKGINLHVEIDEEVPHQNELAMWAGFDLIKKDKFGTSAERLDPVKIDAKKFSHRYNIFIHNMTGTGSSGRGELPGNDFVVSLGGFDEVGGHKTGTDKHKEATLMHEMGHTLDLHHGGQDDFNCKPNYFSIMSYTFQFEYNVPGRPLDYSTQASPTLNEASLNEMLGVQGPAGRSTIIGGQEFNVTNSRVPTGIPLNYDRDGTPNEGNSTANVNWLHDSCDGEGSVLTGYTDWDNIEYDFRTTRDFISDGAPHPEEGSTEEMNFNEIMAMAASISPTACTIPETGNWTITENCTLATSSTAPANVIVQNNSVLTIPNGLTLTFDSSTNNITIEFGSGILIQSGGTIT
ncbi:MAG TPA: hypothetical protein VMW74_02900 [Nitrosopumilaceae archaeon]|nr:hypothetical protein [Nitrosopumilaceae archaeon]